MTDKIGPLSRAPLSQRPPALLEFSTTQTTNAEQVETRNPYQPPCFHALFYIQPQPRDRRALSLIGLRAL
jgi:hypothetical protein